MVSLQKAAKLLDCFWWMKKIDGAISSTAITCQGIFNSSK